MKQRLSECAGGRRFITGVALARRALRAGASGFLLKDVRPEELLAGIRAVAAGDAVIAPAPTGRLLDEYVQQVPQPVDGWPRKRD